MQAQIYKIKITKCPLCGGYANSPHHIKPLADRGMDEDRNKVLLCKRCHDIVEAIYQDSGLEYCPALVRTLQREFGWRLNVSDYRYKTITIKKGEEKKHIKPLSYDPNAYTVCNNCGIRFYRGKKTGQLFCNECTEYLLKKLHKPLKLRKPHKLGEIKVAKALGYKVAKGKGNGSKFIWAACVYCGKERWVPVKDGKPKSQRCISCSNRERFSQVAKKDSQKIGSKI